MKTSTTHYQLWFSVYVSIEHMNLHSTHHTHNVLIPYDILTRLCLCYAHPDKGPISLNTIMFLCIANPLFGFDCRVSHIIL